MKNMKMYMTEKVKGMKREYYKNGTLLLVGNSIAGRIREKVI